MNVWLAFFIGLFLGLLSGITLLSLLIIFKQSDEHVDRLIREANNTKPPKLPR